MASAQFRFGSGRLGDVRHAAIIPVGTGGNKGKFTALSLEVDIPALSRRGALEPLGGQLDVSRDILTLRMRGLDIPLKVNRMGPYILSVAVSGMGRPQIKEAPVAPAPYFEWAPT